MAAVATHQLAIPLATPRKVGETWVVPQLRWGDDGINPAMNLVCFEMSWDVLSGYYEWHLSSGSFRSLMILSSAVSKLNAHVWCQSSALLEHITYINILKLEFSWDANHFLPYAGGATCRWEVKKLWTCACAGLCQDSYCFCEVWSEKSMVSSFKATTISYNQLHTKLLPKPWKKYQSSTFQDFETHRGPRGEKDRSEGPESTSFSSEVCADVMLAASQVTCSML